MKPRSEKKQELGFVCPECGSKDMLCANYQSWVEVEHIYADGGYDGPKFDNDIVTFSCGECGYVLTDEKGNKVYEEELAGWIKVHCSQDDSILSRTKRNSLLNGSSANLGKSRGTPSSIYAGCLEQMLGDIGASISARQRGFNDPVSIC